MNRHFRQTGQTGITLIELLTTVSIVAVLLALAVPGFGTMIKNSQIRTAAEATSTALKRARADAIRRNTPIHFSLMKDVDSDSCEKVSEAQDFILSAYDPSQKCSYDLTETPYIEDDPEDQSPGMYEIWRGAKIAPSVRITGFNNQTTATFTPLGRLQTPNGLRRIDITIPSSAQSENLPNLRNLRILIDTSGAVFLCIPDMENTTPPDPRRCPDA